MPKYYSTNLNNSASKMLCSTQMIHKHKQTMNTNINQEMTHSSMARKSYLSKRSVASTLTLRVPYQHDKTGAIMPQTRSQINMHSGVTTGSNVSFLRSQSAAEDSPLSDWP